MNAIKNQPTGKPKRETWTIDPPEDIKRMMERAMKEIGGDTRGLRTRLLIECARIGFAQKGLARKKDLAQ